MLSPWTVECRSSSLSFNCRATAATRRGSPTKSEAAVQRRRVSPSTTSRGSLPSRPVRGGRFSCSAESACMAWLRMAPGRLRCGSRRPRRGSFPPPRRPVPPRRCGSPLPRGCGGRPDRSPLKPPSFPSDSRRRRRLNVIARPIARTIRPSDLIAALMYSLANRTCPISSASCASNSACSSSSPRSLASAISALMASMPPASKLRFCTARRPISVGMAVTMRYWKPRRGIGPRGRRPARRIAGTSSRDAIHPSTAAPVLPSDSSRPRENR